MWEWQNIQQIQEELGAHKIRKATLPAASLHYQIHFALGS